MGLIKNLAEIKAVLPGMISNLSDISQLANFDYIESKYIIPIIGQTLYDTLVANYDADTLDPDETILVKKLQLPIVAHAMREKSGFLTLVISNSGVKNLQPGGTDRVYGWQLQELKTTLITYANEGTNVFLDYLFTNKALFPEWTSSDQYAKIASLLIRTGSEFNDNYTLFQPQRSYFIMRNLMTDVQELFIEASIGKELLVYLRDKVAPDTNETEGIRLLKKAISFFTIFKSCQHFSVQFADLGFTILGDKNDNRFENDADRKNDIKLLEMKMDECEREGNSFLEKARSVLVANYTSVTVTAEYKTAFDAGPLSGYVNRSERTSGNEERNFFVMP